MKLTNEESTTNLVVILFGSGPGGSAHYLVPVCRNENCRTLSEVSRRLESFREAPTSVMEITQLVILEAQLFVSATRA